MKFVFAVLSIVAALHLNPGQAFAETEAPQMDVNFEASATDLEQQINGFLGSLRRSKTKSDVLATLPALIGSIQQLSASAQNEKEQMRANRLLAALSYKELEVLMMGRVAYLELLDSNTKL